MNGNTTLNRVMVLLASAGCVLAQAPDIMDIAPPVDVARPAPWFYILVGVAIAAAAAWWFLLRRSPASEESVTFVDAHELAVRRIDALAGESDLAVMFEQLEAAMRAYLERRFDIESPQATLRELGARTWQRGTMTPEQAATLSALLETCEMVRYGGYRPDAATVRHTLAAARGWIELTQLRLAAPSPGSLLFRGTLSGSARDAAH